MDITIKLEDLASLTKQTAEELKGKLTNADTGEALPSDKIKTVLNTAMQSRFDEIAKNAAGRSVKDALSKREKDLAEKYGITDFSNLDDLVSKVATKNQGSFDESKVLQHPTVVAEITSLKTAIKNEKEAAKKLQSEFEQKEFNRGFSEYAKQQLKTLGYDISNNRAVDAYVKDLRSQAKWKKTDGGYIPTDENGYTLQENHEDIGFDTLVDKTTWLNKSGQNGGTPPPPPGGQGQGKGTHASFTSADYATVEKYAEKYKELSKNGDHAAAKALEKAYYENKK